MNEDQQPNTVENRIVKDKEILIEEFKKTPIIQVACEKTGVSRTTYYRWRKEDPFFLGRAEEALQMGRYLINDLSESKLIKKIQFDEDFQSIKFWLNHNHPLYMPKVPNQLVTNHFELSMDLVKEIDKVSLRNAKSEYEQVVKPENSGPIPNPEPQKTT